MTLAPIAPPIGNRPWNTNLWTVSKTTLRSCTIRFVRRGLPKPNLKNMHMKSITKSSPRRRFLKRRGASAAGHGGTLFLANHSSVSKTRPALLRAPGGARAAPNSGFFRVVFLSSSWESVVRPGSRFCMDL